MSIMSQDNTEITEVEKKTKPEPEVILFINGTHKCNMTCDRCFYPEVKRKDDTIMNPSFLRTLISHSYFRDCPDLVVVWEGGEIACIGEKKFRELLDIVKELLPNARQTMVTNLLIFPDWLANITKEFFNNEIETTFSFERKYTKSFLNKHEKYLKQFKQSLSKVNDLGIYCPINFELNIESYKKGPEAVVEFVRETGHGQIEFDMSVDFPEWVADMKFTKYGYPDVTATVSYKDFYKYLIDLDMHHREELDKLGFDSSVFYSFENRESCQSFNVMEEMKLISLNPDGTVTTNPLFSGVDAAHIGDLKVNTVDEILASKTRFVRGSNQYDRLTHCHGCEFFTFCKGGGSHMAMRDGSGECSGGYSLWKYFEEKRSSVPLEERAIQKVKYPEEVK